MRAQAAYAPRAATHRVLRTSAVSHRTPAQPHVAAHATLPRRVLLASGVALVSQASPAQRHAAHAAGPSFKSAAGLLYCDDVVGEGEAAQAGDVVKILYSAHAMDGPDPDVIGSTFDPYGSAGSSSSRGYKVTLGESDTDIPLLKGWELSILGGDGLPPMRAGGRRIVRLPPALAYGSEGHLCRRGNKAACEVPPDTPIQIETVLLGRAY